jgi:DNA-binding response OmpR family regulator
LETGHYMSVKARFEFKQQACCRTVCRKVADQVEKNSFGKMGRADSAVFREFDYARIVIPIPRRDVYTNQVGDPWDTGDSPETDGLADLEAALIRRLKRRLRRSRGIEIQMPPILIAEDDKKTASLVALYLEREGFQTIVAYDGRQALELARSHSPSLVILDLMLPLLDGWEVCRELRRSSDVAILILSARDEEIDRVAGLTLGADDYVVKPFSPRELVARVKAILRRGRLGRPEYEQTLSHGDLILDPEKRKVTLCGRPVTLTPHEFSLLRTLMTTPGKVFTRDELLTRLYPNEDVAVIDRVVDVHIGKLRQKIEQDPSKPAYILTVRGVGYQFSETSET